MKALARHLLCATTAALALSAFSARALAGAPPGAAGLEPLVAALVAAAERNSPEQPPEAVATAAKALFPHASLVTFGRKSLNGVPCYEVLLRQAEQDVSVDIGSDGSIGSIQLQARIEQLAADEQARIAAAARNGPVHGVGLHLRLGIAREGTFVPIEEPEGHYQVRYLRGSRTRVANVALAPDQVPAALAQCGAVLPGR
jgi:hypothetical protein